MKKILVIEDEKEIVNTLKFRIQTNGMNAVSAYSGEEGLKMAETENPDLIILDIGLPDIDGYEVCVRIRTGGTTKNIPIIVLTAKGMIKDIDKLMDVGANDYVLKPYEWEHLLGKIKKFI